MDSDHNGFFILNSRNKQGGTHSLFILHDCLLLCLKNTWGDVIAKPQLLHRES